MSSNIKCQGKLLQKWLMDELINWTETDKTKQKYIWSIFPKVPWSTTAHLPLNPLPNFSRKSSICANCVDSVGQTKKHTKLKLLDLDFFIITIILYVFIFFKKCSQCSHFGKASPNPSASKKDQDSTSCFLNVHCYVIVLIAFAQNQASNWTNCFSYNFDWSQNAMLFLFCMDSTLIIPFELL